MSKIDRDEVFRQDSPIATDVFQALDRQWRRTGGKRYAKQKRREARKANRGNPSLYLPPRGPAASPVSPPKAAPDSRPATGSTPSLPDAAAPRPWDMKRGWIVFLPKEEAHQETASAPAEAPIVAASAAVGQQSPAQTRTRPLAERSERNARVAGDLVRAVFEPEPTVTAAGRFWPARPGVSQRAPSRIPSFETLTEIGAILIQDLTQDEVKAFEARGAAVFHDDVVTLPAPIASGTRAPAVGSGSADITSTVPWHLSAIGVVNKAGERLAELESLEMQDVIIGMIDTGADGTLPELKGRISWFKAYDSENSRDQSGTVSAINTPKDFATAGPHANHGTNVAALIAGTRSGVAPKAKLAVAAALTELTPKGMGGTRRSIVIAFEDLQVLSGTLKATLVLNMSLSSKGFDKYLLNRISDSEFLSSTYLIAAIGNDGEIDNLGGSPGDYASVLAVGATDCHDVVAGFSAIIGIEGKSGRQKPDLYAPGDGIQNSVSDPGAPTISGTSFAAPIASALTAIYQAQGRLGSGGAAASKDDLLAILTHGGAPVTFPPARRQSLGLQGRDAARVRIRYHPPTGGRSV